MLSTIFLVGLALVDLLARLAVPVTLAALTREHEHAALASAALVTCLAVARSVLAGHAVEAWLRKCWGDLAHEASTQALVRLRARPEDQDVAMLADAVHAVARHHASTLPQLLANSVGLVLAGGLILWLLGPAVAAVAALVTLALVGFGALVHGRVSRAQASAWQRLGAVIRDAGALLDGAAELRASGRQEALRGRLVTEVAQMARAERHGNAWAALVALLPVGVALVVVAAPLHEWVAAVTARLGGRAMVEAGILGATTLALALGLVHALQEAVRARPYRATLARFMAPGSEADGPRGATREPTAQPLPDLRVAPIILDSVAIQYAGNSHATPRPTSFVWPVGRGLVLTGDNGSGKSSLALAILGLLEPTAGAIRIGDTEVRALAWPCLRSRIAYLPQQPLVVPGASIRWHLELLAQTGIDEGELINGLRRVGLWSTLARRARLRRADPLSIAVGELSGGELRRLHLARAFVGAPDLVVLDEPEAGLDTLGRAQLRGLILELGKRARVLLIAHDPNIVPDGFVELACVEGEPLS